MPPLISVEVHGVGWWPLDQPKASEKNCVAYGRMSGHVSLRGRVKSCQIRDGEPSQKGACHEFECLPSTLEVERGIANRSLTGRRLVGLRPCGGNGRG